MSTSQTLVMLVLREGGRWPLQVPVAEHSCVEGQSVSSAHFAAGGSQNLLERQTDPSKQSLLFAHDVGMQLPSVQLMPLAQSA